MAELEQALFTRLSGHAGLSALVGTRIYPVILPQSPTLPAVTYTRIDGPRVSAMGSDPGVASPRMQVDSWGSTYASARAVAAQVRAALQRWRGTVASVEVLDSFIDGDQDLFEPEAGIYRVRHDYIIWHRE